MKIKYSVELEKDESGRIRMIRENAGFNALELLGLTVLLRSEVLEQIAGITKPDEITRRVITPVGEGESL
ncbi:MAG: hypothetical protein ABIL06_13075 [Pseudomonadota bacterium]|uniref:Uncharacterized protein n=1 Tax=viral metagenome TaxID=1070528 RepID=A0A6H1ZIL8_9ZZZZ